MKKTYIGQVEALEIALEKGFELPEEGRESLIVHALVKKLPVEILGKDNKGFYLSEITN